jgi:hypothetical protein
MSEALDDNSVNHGHVMKEGMEENDPDESLKSLQAGQQTPTSGTSTTNSNNNGQEFHYLIKQPRVASIILTQMIYAVTVETPNAARIDAAATETPDTTWYYSSSSARDCEAATQQGPHLLLQQRKLQLLLQK